MRTIAVYSRNSYILVLMLFVLAGCSTADSQTYYRHETAYHAGGKVHTVRSGDTLFSLSRRYNVPVQVIASANGIDDAYTIFKGQRLKIPVPHRTHRVRRGDTLATIASRYKSHYTALAKANNIRAPYTIYPGQVIRVPTYAGPVPATARYATAATSNPRRSSAPRLPQAPARSEGRFAWPVYGPVLSGFGNKPDGQRNDGINISVDEGEAIKATENGIVAYVGNEVKGFGNIILVKHADEWVSAYAHASKILVKKGERIKRGQVIAYAGSTGNVATAQLHFELRRNSKAVDPLRYLESRRVTYLSQE